MTRSPSYRSRRSFSAAAKPAAPPPTMTILAGDRAGVRPHCSVRLQQLLFVLHEDSVVAPLDFPACQRTECRSVQGLSGPQAETGVMPRTPHGVSDHQPVSERTAVIGTGGADRKEVIAALHQQHGPSSNVAILPAPVRKQPYLN